MTHVITDPAELAAAPIGTIIEFDMYRAVKTPNGWEFIHQPVFPELFARMFDQDARIRVTHWGNTQ